MAGGVEDVPVGQQRLPVAPGQSTPSRSAPATQPILQVPPQPYSADRPLQPVPPSTPSRTSGLVVGPMVGRGEPGVAVSPAHVPHSGPGATSVRRARSLDMLEYAFYYNRYCMLQLYTN